MEKPYLRMDHSKGGTSDATASNFNERGGGGWTWILSDIKSLLETGKLLNQH